MRRVLLTLLYLLTFALLGALALRGGDYYALPLLARPRHPLHWQLKPGGSVAIWYGVAGASLMTAMLSYSLRKRIPLLRRAGRLPRWLDFHIWCGVTGPLLILLHSAFKVGGLIAIAFWSMVAVALSGVAGRFLYAQIPRTAAGDELGLEAATGRERELADRLRSELGIDPAELAGRPPPAGLLASLAGLALAPLRARRRFARFRARHRLPHALGRRLGAISAERELLARRIALWKRLHELFHYWHVFHKPFAVLLYLFAAIHIGVAWATGYTAALR
jgi:hypothetical protein